jgi:hypothetical protein
MTENQEADAIAIKWVKRLGLGWHIDTPAWGYALALTGEEAEEYTRDMARLFVLARDPYAIGVKAMEESINGTR